MHLPTLACNGPAMVTQRREHTWMIGKAKILHPGCWWAICYVCECVCVCVCVCVYTCVCVIYLSFLLC
jgi:hypothetical protein